ncbi:unnamed protein product [Sympodiomycopsis kandeliae]
MESMPPATGSSSSPIHIQIVHTSGITRVVHAPKESGVDRLLTAGDDYLVRLLPTSATSSEDAQLIDDATGPVTWIDAGKTHLVVASEDGSVRLYKHQGDSNAHAGYGHEVDGSTQLYGVLARTSLPTRCVALERHVANAKSPRAAICSDDLIVKVVDVEDTKRVNLLTGHSRAVRSASWSPKEAVLVTSSCDGTARVWDCSTSEPGCTKVIENLPATRPEDETDVHAEWHPSGEFFVLPSKTNDMVIYSNSATSGFVRSGVFSPPARGSSHINPPTGQVTFATFSPNGRYLAAGTTDGQVTIWETATRLPIKAQKADGNVTGISWHPDSDALAWVDTNGQLIRWSDVVGHQYPSPFEAVAFGSSSRQTQAQKSSREQVDDLFAGTGIDDEDDPGQTSRYLDAEAGDDDQGDGMHDVGGDDDDDGMDDFVVDDDQGHYTRPKGSAMGQHRSRALAARSSGLNATPSSRPQAPFQPNSTPMRNARRFLSLSLFGSLISIDQDTHNVVSFESFDSAARRNWKLVDHFGYSMASVGATGALLACPQKGDGSPSAVHFKPFEAAGAWSAPGAEWNVELPRGEQVVAVAMGGNPPRRPGNEFDEDENSIAKTASTLTATAVVATSNGYLRFFSSSGLQRYIWAFGSQVVAMSAGKQHVIVVHRNQSGGALDGYQNLSFSLIDLISFEVRQTGTMPLGKDTELRWVGFNELDVPAFYDGKGVLYLLDRAFATHGQARWIPVLDSHQATNSHESEEMEESSSKVQFWPLSMSSTQLFCVFVRGAVRFPDPSVAGHPLIQEVDLKLPLLNTSGPSGGFEEKHLRQTLLASSIRSSFASLATAPNETGLDIPDPSTLVHNSDKELLQLIQLSCKEDQHSKALDASLELSNARMLDAAIQIAQFFHLPSLAERMNGLKSWVETRDERMDRLNLEGGNQGIDVDEFSHHAQRRKRSRGGDGQVFVHGSQSPEIQSRKSTTAHARKALTEGFDVGSTPRRSQGFLTQEYGASGSANGKRNRPHDDHMDDDEERHGRDISMSIEPSSSTTSMPPPSTTTAPLSTNRGNPFARQASNATRGASKSMHKSNSFFDRAEADLLKRDNAPKKKTKQSVLFAKTPKSSSSTRVEENTDSESLQDALHAAQQMEEKENGLEETQYPDQAEEETQELDAQEESQEEGSGYSKLEAFRRGATSSAQA